jgi:hypothetical protein
VTVNNTRKARLRGICPDQAPLEHAGQLIVGCAVKRVSYSRTGRDVGRIQQSPEVYPEWLRHRVSPPKRDSMPVSTGAVWR